MTISKLILIIALCVLTPSFAHAVGLKENSVVTDEYIRLGDVFYGLSHNEDKVIGSAPAPGQDMVLNARILLKISKKMGLSWRPSSSMQRVTLTRQGTVIDRELIEANLKEQLQNKGLSGSYELIFTSTLSPIILPPEMEATMDVTDLNIKPDRNWFEATIIAPSKDNPIQRQHVSGTIQRMISVPVIRGALRKGDIIGARDIEMVEIREQSLKSNIILSSEDLIGLTPRRMLSPGKPIKDMDVEAPIIVKRGEFVTMYFNNGPLQLTARGKAMENGAKDDLIRVTNVASSKTIEAKVTNTREVHVSAF